MKFTPLHVPELIREHGLHPTKGLGQNFLINEGALEKVVVAASIQPEDSVLEIGPGLGSLTRHLALMAKHVVAVELDETLLPVLGKVLLPYTNIQIIHADILAVNLVELELPPGYLVVANIPYYITSALLRQLLEAPRPPARLVLTVQKEVAERICSQAGSMSLLSLSVQVYGKPQIAAHIAAGSFYPKPNVDSAVVRVDLYEQPLISPDKLDLFFQLIKAGFSQKRKTLSNTLSNGMQWSKQETISRLEAAGIDPQRRAQTLSLPEWERLVEKSQGEIAW